MGERADLQGLKAKLFSLLKGNADEYWNSLRAYFQARLTKTELDMRIHALLGEENGTCLDFVYRGLLIPITSWTTQSIY